MLKKLGDGLMALFGYPQAQENDGERAVRAALAILRALADLNASNAAGGAPALAARIGLDSGRVLVDSTGEVLGDRRRTPRACRAPRRREKSGSRAACTGRSRDCSSPRTRASMS